MKKSSIIYLVFVMLTGCATWQGGGDKGGGDEPSRYVVKPGKTINGLEKRYISPDLWEKLGLGDRTMLVAIEKGKRIIFVSDGLQQLKHVDNAFPKGRKLASEIQLIQTYNSPPCTSYRDSGGSEGWWPKDCPRD